MHWWSVRSARMVRPISIPTAETQLTYPLTRTLVGAGLKQKSTLRQPLADLIPPHIAHIPENVASFDPAHNAVRTEAGRTLTYDALVVAMGLQVNYGAIEGLPKALADPSSGVSSIYSYQTCDKVWDDIDALRTGRAIFTQPQGVIKCAGGQCLRRSILRAPLTYSPPLQPRRR
jgi:NADPH-dependent 2,4-dienoyl-CoA reductase/sulfur reductase-like enzyme